MRWIIAIYFVFITASFGQSEEIAKDYFIRGEFEKALISYQKLLKKNPRNYSYISRIVEIHQQLEEYDKAEELLLERSEKTKQPLLLVELGYNYSLKGNVVKAEEYFRNALKKKSSFPSALLEMARLYSDRKIYPRAQAFMSRYESVGQSSPKALELCSIINQNMNDIAKSESCKSALLRLFPDSPEAQRAN